MNNLKAIDTVFIMGHFNRRDSDIPNFINQDKKDMQYILEVYKLELIKSNCCCEDLFVHQILGELIKVCIFLKFRIMNGRNRRNIQDKCTYYRSRGLEL